MLTKFHVKILKHNVEQLPCTSEVSYKRLFSSDPLEVVKLKKF